MVCELEGRLRSSEVLAGGSPGYPLSSCRCSAMIGAQLFKSATYPPTKPTNHLSLYQICPLASAYSRPFCSFFLFPSPLLLLLLLNGFCCLIFSDSSTAFTYSRFLSTHDLCCFMACATSFSLRVFLLLLPFPCPKFLRKIIRLVQIVTIICQGQISQVEV